MAVALCLPFFTIAAVGWVLVVMAEFDRYGRTL